MSSVALITGITGQDGSYLAEFLLSRGYEVHGLVRPSSTPNLGRLAHLSTEDQRDGTLTLHHGDLLDSARLTRLLEHVRPDEIYNLAAQSHVGMSFQMPTYTIDAGALGTSRLLQAVVDLRLQARVYQAGSSEMFGDAPAPQSERSPFLPRSPYAIAKLSAYWLVRTYREAFDLHAATGILFNHESPRRSEDFVTRKVTMGVAAIIAGQRRSLRLGNLAARRDWGHARDYVVAMHRMLQLEEPEDLVVGTGVTHSVEELVDLAFGLTGLDWRGFVESDPNELRPLDVHHLQADASRAAEVLGWKAETGFRDLIAEMLDHDLRLFGLDLDEARRLAARIDPPVPHA